MSERTLDIGTAIYNRDGHSSFAIMHMAKDAGVTPQVWGTSHREGGLTDDEAIRYDAYWMQFNNWWLDNLPHYDFAGSADFGDRTR
jgi:hypothetical protein